MLLIELSDYPLTERLLAGNSFVVICHVTTKQPVKSLAVGVKIVGI